MPFAEYRDFPVEFFRNVLGIQPWDRQEEILRAMAIYKKVAVRSGHKVGKSTSDAGIACWWMSTRPRAKVLFTSSSNENISEILWPELRKIHREAKQPLGGYLLTTPHGGWTFPDGRRCWGLSTDDAERAAGKSGDELLIIADEASGIEDAIFEAHEGNLAGGGAMLMTGNPTQDVGQFARAFAEESDVWHGIRISSEETPNYRERRIVIPGLATYDWVEQRRRKWGENNPRYLIRVKGEFAGKGSNVVIGVDIVKKAQDRWATTPAVGALELGVDVARFGDDDSVVYPRRGKKALAPKTAHGADTMQVVELVLDVVREHRPDKNAETVKIKVDVIGIGAGVADVLRTFEREWNIEVVDVNVSEAAEATEEGDESDEGFPNKRSQLWFGMGDWLADGGAIPPREVDEELGPELMAPKYGFNTRGQRVVEPKENIKARLQRSPDHAEALMLSLAKGEGRDTGGIFIARRG